MLIQWCNTLKLIIYVFSQQCPKHPMFQNSTFYIEFKDPKNPHVLEVLGWRCRGLWRFLTGVLVPDHDGEGSRMSQTPKFCFLH